MTISGISPGELGLGSKIKSILFGGPRAVPVRPCPPRRREPGDPDTRQAVAHPRPLRRTRALLAVPRVVFRHRIRHWIRHADRVMSCRARTRHMYGGTRRGGRMT